MTSVYLNTTEVSQWNHKIVELLNIWNGVSLPLVLEILLEGGRLGLYLGLAVCQAENVEWSNKVPFSSFRWKFVLGNNIVMTTYYIIISVRYEACLLHKDP